MLRIFLSLKHNSICFLKSGNRGVRVWCDVRQPRLNSHEAKSLLVFFLFIFWLLFYHHHHRPSLRNDMRQISVSGFDSLLARLPQNHNSSSQNGASVYGYKTNVSALSRLSRPTLTETSPDSRNVFRKKTAEPSCDLRSGSRKIVPIQPRIQK